MPKSLEVSVLLIEEDDKRWSAQCLEYDIVAQADTLKDLRYEVEKTLLAYIVLDEESEGRVLKELGKAPQKYWDMYESSDLAVEPRKELFQPVGGLQRRPKPQFRVAA